MCNQSKLHKLINILKEMCIVFHLQSMNYVVKQNIMLSLYPYILQAALNKDVGVNKC